MKLIFFLIFLFILLTVSAAQPLITEPRTDLQQAISKGLLESIEWYDVPILAVYFGKLTNKITFPSKITLAPGKGDIDIQKNIGMDGRISPGSIDKDIIPNGIFYARMLFNIGNDLLGDARPDAENYKHTFLFYKSLIYTYVFTETIKNIIRRERPDGTDDRSFFSGHSATTFAMSTFLFRELDAVIDNEFCSEENRLLNSSLKTAAFTTLYGWAGYVAFCRMRDNKHYLSDVLIGAISGILISNFIYNEHTQAGETPLRFGVNLYNEIPVMSFSLNF